MGAAPDISETSDARPLEGVSVLVTRARHQAGALAELLESRGAGVIACPVIEQIDPPDLQPLRGALASLREYDWVIFGSTNAVDRFLDRLESEGPGLGALEGVKVAAVGSATAARLEKRGVRVDLVPEEYRGEGLIDAFADLGADSDWRVLVPRALEAREVLPDALREMGCEVDVVPVYRTVAAAPDPDVLARLDAGDADAVTFASPSTVKHLIAFLENADRDPKSFLGKLVIASIGPVTTRALEDRGYRADVEADPSTMEGLVAGLEAYYRGLTGVDERDGGASRIDK